MGSGKMFDKIAGIYDVTNRLMSLGLDQNWREHMVRECVSKSKASSGAGTGSAFRVLDLATGTADVALQVALPTKDGTHSSIDAS